MRVLLGTPIHETKDYAMERWLKCVSSLTYPVDILMVDNSSAEDYLEKVIGYCTKLGLKNFKITHIELSPKQGIFERVARAREVIRKEVLAGGYDAWFSLECDQIVPPDSLEKLVKLMRDGHFMMVNHNGWARENPDLPIYDLGVSLVRRNCLENHSFLLGFGADPDMPTTWEPGEAWFKKRVLKDGGKIAEVDGVIKPVLHLSEPAL